MSELKHTVSNSETLMGDNNTENRHWS